MTQQKVLDHGFVELVAVMGSDTAIEEAARVSYTTGTRKVSETRGLLRYLLRHRHTSPFEMATLKFHVKAPDFVIWQWVRHRTGSFNVESARYSIMSNEVYIPTEEALAEQSQHNKQGRDRPLSLDEGLKVVKKMEDLFALEDEVYQDLLNTTPDGQIVDPTRPRLARELARIVRGFGFYREFYWTVNLWNFFHFLHLRLDPHAQYEIRKYAEVAAHLTEPSFPLSFEAFYDYIHDARTFSAQEMQLLRDLLGGPEKVAQLLPESYLSKREQEEFLAKLGL